VTALRVGKICIARLSLILLARCVQSKTSPDNLPLWTEPTPATARRQRGEVIMAK
jgi:hypothetical protein